LQAKEPQGNKGNVDFIIKPGRADGSKKKKKIQLKLKMKFYHPIVCSSKIAN